MRLMGFIGLRPFLLTVLLGCLVTTSANPTNKKMRQVFSWKTLDFAYKNQKARECAIKSGDFVPLSSVPRDVDVYTRKNKSSVVFITIPRSSKGVPVTLGYVTNLKNSEGNPIIAPYPNWDWQQPNDHCSGLISIFRIQIDSCGRMWVLDTGKIRSRQICPPQLLMFSLKNNQLQSRYVFPREQYSDRSLMATPVADIRDAEGLCLDTYVYIADVQGYSMIVYDHRHSTSWKIVNNLFYPYPPYGIFTINNVSFNVMDGIMAMALGPIAPNGDRLLFFHSMASVVESWVPTSIIRNASLFKNNLEGSPRSFKPFSNERSSQSALQVMDENGVLFFGLISETAIGCWNSKDYPEFGQNNIEKIVTDSKTLQFAAGIKIVTSLNKVGKQELWVLTNSIQKVRAGSLSANETNFRILAGCVDELTRGTKCDVVAHGINNGPRRNVNRGLTVHNHR